MIVITVAGWFFGEQAVQGQVSTQISEAMGEDAAKQIETMLASTQVSGSSWLATIVGIGTLIFGATGVFYQLQQSLNQMWEVKPKPDAGIKEMIKDRAFSFGLILVIGFLLLIFMVISTLLAAFSDVVASYLPDYAVYVFRALQLVVSFGVITLLFAAMFKILPDVEIRWRHVWVGAVVTALLFVIGKYAMSLYFSYSDPGSAYGAAGSLILVMVWISYSSLILFFGAEFTQVYANQYGDGLEPSAHAERVVEGKRSQTSTAHSSSDTARGHAAESKVAYVKNYSDKK